MPDTTPNLGLILSRYDDAEHRDDNTNLQILDKPPLTAKGSIQTAKATYILTAADILAGFCSVPIVWPIPWPDMNFKTTFGVYDPYGYVTLDYTVGDMHFPTEAGF